MPLSKEEIENRVGFHKATVEGENATLPKHRELRLAFRGFMELLNELLPDGRAKSVTMTELETVSMWAHKSIAEMAPLIPESYKDKAGEYYGIHHPEYSKQEVLPMAMVDETREPKTTTVVGTDREYTLPDLRKKGAQITKEYFDELTRPELVDLDEVNPDKI